MNHAHSIRDLGDAREVAASGLALRVPYSLEFLEQLAVFRQGRDLLDELLRSEYRPYIHDRLQALLRECELSGWQALDYGCGMGGSAVCLARLGVGHITGVDLVNTYSHVWARRLSEAGFPTVGTFVQAEDSAQLPFKNEQFDAVFLNGLIEHLLPEERKSILAEALRVTRLGGFVFVTETPNKRFPRNSHTKLWLSEWLPLSLAAKLAHSLGPRNDFPKHGRTAIFRTGMRGASVGDIQTALGPAAHLIASDERLVEMEFLLPRNPLDTSAMKQRLGVVLLQATRFAAQLLRRPLQDLSPHLNLQFRRSSPP